MITELTAAQVAALPAVRDEWLAHGLATEAADRPEAERGVREAYAAAGLAPPRFMVWLGSPLAGAVGQAAVPHVLRGQVDAQVDAQVYGQVYAQVDAQVHGQVRAQVDAQVRAQVRGQVDGQVDAQVDAQVYAQVYGQVYGQVHGQVDAQVRDQVYAQVHAQVDAQVRGWWRGRIAGQHWAGYYSLYDAMDRIGVDGIEPLHGQMRVARSAGWWWCHREFAVLTERPTDLRRDAQGRLHSETGPAIRYPDGWGVWAWHGVRIEPWVIDGTATIERILREPNSEVRRCAIEAYGWPRFIAAAGLERIGDPVPDPGNPGQDIALYSVPERIYDEPVNVLIATNGTPERDGTRRTFGLTVPASIDDPLSAAAWGYGLNTSDYAQTVRRS